jgi:transcriptional regulator GlxA family with amidase domain
MNEMAVYAPQAARDVKMGREFEKELVEPEVQRAVAENPRLARLERYVQDHLHEPLPLGRAADIAGLERTYFSKFFHETTGCKFSTWNRAVRIQRAASLLRLSAGTVRSIAACVGYRNITTFERASRSASESRPAPTAMRTTDRSSPDDRTGWLDGAAEHLPPASLVFAGGGRARGATPGPGMSGEVAGVGLLL